MVQKIPEGQKKSREVPQRRGRQGYHASVLHGDRNGPKRSEVVIFGVAGVRLGWVGPPLGQARGGPPRIASFPLQNGLRNSVGFRPRRNRTACTTWWALSCRGPVAKTTCRPALSCRGPVGRMAPKPMNLAAWGLGWGLGPHGGPCQHTHPGVPVSARTNSDGRFARRFAWRRKCGF